jgi:hypothetical protein
MGGGSYSSSAWSAYSSSVSHKSVKEIFTRNEIDEYLDPLKIKIREARDSEEHPNSIPIIIDLDVTGSMGMLAEHIAKKGLGVVFQELLDRKPVDDPQLMFMANGDVACDSAPLQVSQFESSNCIVEQLEKIWIEHGGGGNRSESYDAPWYFAARRTSLDSYNKRGKKGYLFTVGDEEAPYGITKEQVKEFFGDTIQANLSAKELLKMAEQKFNVFHIVVEEGNHCTYAKDEVYSSWRELLGQRVLPLTDHTKLAEVIVSAIQITEGVDKKKVTDSWDGSTALAVGKAVEGLVARTDESEGLVVL